MPLIKRVLKYLFPYKKRLAAGIVSMLIHSFLTIFFIKVFKDLLETIITDISAGQEGIVKLTWIVLFMVFIYFVKGIVFYGQKYLTSYVAQKAVRDIRNELYQHLQELSLGFYNKRKTGELLSRVTNDVERLEGAIVDGSVNLFYQFFTFVGGIGYLFYLSVPLTLFLIVVMPLIAYLLVKFNRKIRKVSKDVQIKIGDVTDILQETLSAVKIIKSFGREEYEYQRFSAENQANFRARVKNAQYKAVISPVIEFVAALAITSILWFGGYQVMQGNMRPSELIAFFTLLLTIIGPLKSLTNLSGMVQQALASAERIFETMDLDTKITTGDEQYTMEEVKGYVKFEDITFSYDKEDTILNNINFEACPGEVVALVGASGAGKTTLVDLLPRFYDPNQGRILIDGHDIKTVKLNSLRRHIGIVPQETILFSGTLENNIAYGNLDASREMIIEAARAANAHDFIMEFDDGYDTVVGERGVGLSGGQRQRIAIARAILKDPRILILDEATSALDAESESLVQEALNRLMKNRTTFIIAHRLTTIKDADKILVLDRGQIQEQGTHEFLINKGGIYYNLYQGHFQGNKKWA